MQLERFFAVSQSRSLEAFEAELVRFAADMEFPLISGAMVFDRPETATRSLFLPFGNIPEDFIEIAKDPEDGLRSPVNALLKRSSLPFVYDQQLFAAAGAGDIWEKHAPFGYKNGIAVALHMPGAKHFLLGVDRPDPLPTDQRLARLMADLQLLAVHAQACAESLLKPVQDAQPVELSPRERDILRWTRDGKSASVVAQLLHVSPHTVDYHLRNVFRKLDAAGKHQAVIKAMKLGLL